MTCNVCEKKKLKKVLIFGKKPIVHHLKTKKKIKIININLILPNVRIVVTYRSIKV